MLEEPWHDHVMRLGTWPLGAINTVSDTIEAHQQNRFTGAHHVRFLAYMLCIYTWAKLLIRSTGRKVAVWKG